MRVVSNTSPISNLAIIGRLEFLKRRYTEIFIPSEVALELSALSHAAGRSQIQAALATGWLRVETMTVPSALALSRALDAGEDAAITLALALKADVLRIDEKRGRAAARAAGLAVGACWENSSMPGNRAGDRDCAARLNGTAKKPAFSWML